VTLEILLPAAGLAIADGGSFARRKSELDRYIVS
jgi:hypothetical protein